MASGRRNGATQEAPAKEKSPPVWKRRIWTGAGAVEVSVFSKVKDDIESFFVAVRRTWKNDEGYQDGNLFSPHELLVLADALQKAYAFIDEQIHRE